MIFKKILVPAVSAALAAALLCGCGNSTTQETTLMETPDDIVEQVAGIPKDTVFLTIDGHEITAEEYLYWACQSIDSMYNYGSDTYDIDLNDSEYKWIDTYWEDGIKPAVLNCIENYCQAEIHAKDYDLDVTDDEVNKDVETYVDNAKSYYDSEDDFKAALSQLCITETGYRKLAEESVWYNLLYNKLYNEDSKDYPTDDEVLEYADNAGYYNCKYFFLSTGTKYTDEGVEEVHQRAEQALDIITSNATAEERDAAMDDFITNENWNEDTDSTTDGLLTTGSWLDDTFDEGVRNLEVGEIGIIEDPDYGYFVVERLAIDPDSLRDQCGAAKFGELISEWNEDADVQYTDAFNDFDFRQFYINLTDYRMATDVDGTETTTGSDASDDESSTTAESESVTETTTATAN